MTNLGTTSQLYRHHPALAGEISASDVASMLAPHTSTGAMLLFGEQKEYTAKELVSMIVAADALSLHERSQQLLRKFLRKLKGASSSEIATQLDLDPANAVSDKQLADNGWLVLN